MILSQKHPRLVRLSLHLYPMEVFLKFFFLFFRNSLFKLPFRFGSHSTRTRRTSLLEAVFRRANSAVSNLGVERDRTLNSSEDPQAFLLHPTCWFWPALWGKTNAYRGSHPKERSCALTPSMRGTFTVLGVNKPLLTPHLGLLSETTICPTASCFLRGGTLGILQGSKHQRPTAPFPLFNSTVLAVRRTSRETLHLCAFYCLCLGGNEKTFSSRFSEYKQILAPLNLLSNQTYILLRCTSAEHWHTQGDGFSLSKVIYPFSGF